MKRRDFLKSSLLTASMLSLVPNAFGQQPVQQAVPKPLPTYGDPKSDFLTAYIYDSPNSAVWIRWKNSPLTCYRAEALQKYPYFYPLRALRSGLSLTSETAQPWPHHRSVFFGADRVNGRNYWQNNPDKDRIVSKKLSLGECTEKSAEILNECRWTPFQGEPILADRRRYLLTILNDETYTLDCYFELTALTEVTFEKTNHGFFGVRTEQDLSVDGGGTLLNSEGEQKEANTLHKPAKWMAAYGKRYGREDGLVEGVAVLSPPYRRRPFDANLWFTRDYGNFSPMPFDAFQKDEKFVMPKDDTLKLAYRIVAFTGTPTGEFLNGQWDEFAKVAEGKYS
ncbi:MAG: PmoA family protein [Planctomycetaceae bacterium]|nr:PmoA family protein [Planctomycetaceae bacterium]